MTRSHDACAAPPASSRRRALVAVLRTLVAQIATLSAAVEHAVDAHPDGESRK